MWKNRNHYHGLSILPFSDHTYQQAPFQSCSELEYNTLFNKLVDIDLEKVIEFDDNVQYADVVACAGGGCEV